MTTLVKVISNIIETGYRIVKLRRLGNGDIQTARQVGPFGIDSAPPKGMTAIYAETNKKGKNVIIGYLHKSLLAEDGETRIYSVDEDGEVSVSIFLKADGTMEIGGSANNMVRFNELQSGFNQLKSDHNDLVNAFNAHVHPTAASGPPSIPTPGTGIPAVASTASIDSSKIDEIKTL